MNTFKLAFNNFRNNLRTYKVYILAITFTVGMFYNFEALRFNPDIIKYKAFEGTAKIAAMASLVMLGIFLFFFIWYSSNTFLRQRKKEIAMFCFIGVGIEEYGILFFLESLIIGGTSLVSGLLFGVLSSRLFFMLLGKITVGISTINFSIPIQGIKETTVVFIIFYIVISILEYIKIRRSKLIDLINASKIEDKLKKTDKIKGFLGGIILICSYITISKDQFGIAAMFSVLIVIVFVVATYWLFQGFIPTVILGIQRNKKIFYRGVNIIAISNLSYRIRKNCKNLTAITILLASSITAFGTCFSLKYSVNIFMKDIAPYDIQYIQGVKELGSEGKNSLENKINSLIYDNNIKKEREIKSEILYLENVELIKKGSKLSAEKIVFIKKEHFKELILKEKNKSQQLKDILEKEIPEDEGIQVLSPLGNIMKFDGVSLLSLDDTIKLKKDVEVSLFGKIVNENIIILGNHKYEEIKSKMKEEQIEVYNIIGINLKNEIDIELINNNQEERVRGNMDNRIAVKSKENLDGLELIGAFLFAGGIIAIVFIVAAGVIVHFNFMNEAIIEKETYQKLMNIGVTPNEIINAVVKQSLFQGGISLIIGIAHASLALSILANIMRMSLFIPGIMSVSLLSSIYILFNILSIRNFIKNILSREQMKEIKNSKYDECIPINAQSF